MKVRNSKWKKIDGWLNPSYGHLSKYCFDMSRTLFVAALVFTYLEDKSVWTTVGIVAVPAVLLLVGGIQIARLKRNREEQDGDSNVE